MASPSPEAGAATVTQPAPATPEQIATVRDAGQTALDYIEEFKGQSARIVKEGGSAERLSEYAARMSKSVQAGLTPDVSTAASGVGENGAEVESAVNSTGIAFGKLSDALLSSDRVKVREASERISYLEVRLRKALARLA